jgi:hypothetical protein
MAARRCFVISPIGAEGSPVREHADDVYDYIVRPAMEACGVEAVRSDHLREPGRISDQMFREIVEGDLCIAVLTGFNPNVFYELAIAQAAGRPVIILIEKGNELPFDIQDLRAVYYDLKPRSLFDRVHANAIAEHVRSVERNGWRATSLLAGYLGGRGGADESAPAFFENSGRFGGPEALLALLEATKDQFDIAGITLGSWRRTRGFADVLKAKTAAGCRVRVLFMDKDNPTLPELINDAIPEASYEGVRANLDRMATYFERMADGCAGGVEVRRLAAGWSALQHHADGAGGSLQPVLLLGGPASTRLEVQCGPGHVRRGPARIRGALGGERGRAVSARSTARTRGGERARAGRA